MEYDLAIFSLSNEMYNKEVSSNSLLKESISGQDVLGVISSLQHLPIKVIDCSEVFKKLLGSDLKTANFKPKDSWFLDNFGFFSENSIGASEKKVLREKVLKDDKFNKSWSDAATGKVQSLIFRQNFEYSRDFDLYENLYPNRNSVLAVKDKKNQNFVCDKISISSMVDMEMIANSEIDLLLEMDSSLQKSIKVKQIIICMSSQHFYFLFDKYKNYKSKFLKQIEQIQPSWVWTTYEFEASNSEHLGLLPESIIFTKDIYQHWFNDNFLVFQKYSKNNFFCKILIPAHLRFHKQFILKQSSLIIEFLKDKLCVSDITARNYPQEYYHSLKEIGPSLENVYDQFYSYPFQNNVLWNYFEQRFFNPNLFQIKFHSYVKKLEKQKRVSA